MNPQNIDLIMAQLRSREVRRQDDAAVGISEAPLPSADEVEMWRGARPPVSVKSEYSLDELLGYSDAAFLQNAYTAVLRRDPDQEGFDSHLLRLRTGLLTKVELLGTLRWSDEGRAKGVHIDGLLAPFLLQRLKRRRIIGPVVAWCHGVLRLGSMLKRIAAHEGAHAREIQMLGTHVNRAVHTLQARIHALSSGQVTLLERVVAVEDGMAQFDELKESILADVRASVDPELARLQSAETALSNENAAINEVITCQLDRIHELEAALSELRGGLASGLASVEDAGATFTSDAAAIKEGIARQVARIHELESGLSAVRDSFTSELASLQDAGATLTGDAVELKKDLDQQSARIHELEYGLSALRDSFTSELASLQDAGTLLASDADAIKKDFDQQFARICELEEHLSEVREDLRKRHEPRAEAGSLQRSLDSLYVSLEERFRGSKELIRERALPYLDVIRDAKVGDLGKPVLDLGCGNGDWLQVLRDNGLSARGVDSNRMFVELCQGRGLDVALGDAVEYLRALPDGVLGAVTVMHVAEHLPFEVLVAMLDECKRVLCVGGVLVLETPNPENLLVASHDFYLDPTHRNPLPPGFLSWLVESRGFQRCRIERLTEAREMYAPPLLHDDVPGAASINSLLSRLHAAPDYAVIGRRL